MARSAGTQFRDDITYLGDPPLHDQEVWIVDVELDALEQRLDGMLLRLMSVEEILGYVREGNLQAFINTYSFLWSQR